MFSTYLPNIEKSCQSEIDAVTIDTVEEGAGRKFIECFLNFVKENDPQREIQDGVRNWLDEHPASYPEFVIGSSCSVESGPDYQKIEECYKCWPEDSLSLPGLEKAKDCVATYLPNIGRACKGETEKLAADDLEQGMKVFQCFMKYVQEHDFPGHVSGSGSGRTVL